MLICDSAVLSSQQLSAQEDIFTPRFSFAASLTSQHPSVQEALLALATSVNSTGPVFDDLAHGDKSDRRGGQQVSWPSAIRERHMQPNLSNKGCKRSRTLLSCLRQGPSSLLFDKHEDSAIEVLPMGGVGQ